MSHLKVSSVFNGLRGVTPEGGQDKRLELIQRIVSSNHFQRSIRLRDFFLYVTERALSNHPEGVTEHEIGCRVFGRRADYEPSEDNIVRVSARQLRAKLKEYFDTDGQDEEWIVEIPKGGYLPVFRLRERPPATSAPELPTAPRSSWLLPVIVLLFLSLAFNVLFWRMRVESPASIGTPRPPSNFIVALFGNSPRITHVVLSDAALVLMQGVVGHRFSLEEYADGSYVTMPWRQARVPRFRQFWDTLSTRQISNIGDMGITTRILLSMPGQGAGVVAHSARNMRSRDFKTGNFIILGSGYSNPWAELLSDGRLNYRFEWNRFGQPAKIRNQHPAPGERSVYVSELRHGPDGASYGTSYARVALLPNLTDTGKVLLVAGISMEATEAAGEYLLDPANLPKILHRFGTRSAENLPYFEMLLKTSALDSAARTAEIIAYRKVTQSQP